MNERDDGHFLHGFLNLVNVHCSLVEEMVEDIVSRQSFLSSLLVAEDEVNPLVEVLGHIVALQSLGGEGAGGRVM